MSSTKDNKKINTEVEKEPIEVEGSFRVNTKTCFCCKKQFVLHMEVGKTTLCLYTDSLPRTLYLKIPREAIVAINKRQIDRYDVFKFSIHYRTHNSNKLSEIKLRTKSRSDTDYWINLMRRIIQPKPYQFTYESPNEEKTGLLFKYGDIKKFYIVLCHLEYIMGKESLKEFFEYGKAKINNGKDDKDFDQNSDLIIIDNNQINPINDSKVHLIIDKDLQINCQLEIGNIDDNNGNGNGNDNIKCNDNNDKETKIKTNENDLVNVQSRDSNQFYNNEINKNDSKLSDINNTNTNKQNIIEINNEINKNNTDTNQKDTLNYNEKENQNDSQRLEEKIIETNDIGIDLK